MELLALAARLEDTPLGLWARGSAIGYPLANLGHLLGLVMLVGAIGVLDLRLLGLFRRLPAAALVQALIPVAAVGLGLMVLSGLVMFSADAGALVRSALFRWKLVLIAAALANVAAFHLVWRRRLESWSGGVPAAARLFAAASLGLWLAAATLGRLIAYA
ncbi:hypothetical protein LJR219_000875 [Phenylobacterium sp. LjRoot219]|uniref:hypothetical protein n=1 Tax=Phenylobacterium sp. LjRoot219 TaxID=3342283 RepID=UPI003ECEBD41